jgi:asparagine N-glycosylation enzyme membrane subunit Stt3
LKHLWIILPIIAIIAAIILRIILPWNTVFTPNGVQFQGVDGYYYMHLADLISHNNMQIPQFDAYYDFPNGVDYSPLPSYYNAYGLFIAFVAWIFTLGHITKQALDFSGALHPAILGILALIPVFVITWKLTKNKWVAGSAMILGSVLAGEFMGRAMLGSADTHCLEIFLFSYAMMFTVLALNDGKLRILYGILAGVFGAVYSVIWQGAIIFPMILALFAVLWLIWTRIKGTPDYQRTCVIAMIIAVGIILYAVFTMGLVSKNIAMLFAPILLVIGIIFYTIAMQKFRNRVYLIPLGVLTVIGVGSIASISFVGLTFYPQWLTDALRQVWNLVGWHTQSVTAEELPLFITLGSISPEVPWVYFAMSWYITFIGIGLMIYKLRKGEDVNIGFILVWSLAMLLPTLAMRRFAYYFAFNVIILTAWTLWLIVQNMISKKVKA